MSQDEHSHEEKKPPKEQDECQVEENTTSSSDIELANLRKHIADEQSKYKLALADMENFRKRMQKEKVDSNRFAKEQLLIDFLTPFDQLEQALSFAEDGSEEVKNWALGFKMILNQFKEIFSSNDVAPFISKGKPFDPHSHEVLEMEETDEFPEGTVIKELMKGYKCGNKILRPARVTVAKKTEKTNVDNK